MVQTTTTTLNDIVGTFIEKSFFGFQQPDLLIYRDAKKFPQARGVGKTALFGIMRPLAKITAATNEGSNPATVALSTDSISVEMAKITNAVEVTFESWQTAIEELSAQVGRELRKNYDRSLEYNILSTLAQRANRSRIDLNTAYQVGGTVDSATATTLVDAALSTPFPNDDDLNDCLVVITGGLGAGQVREITAYTGGTGSCTVGTWDVNPDATSTFKVIKTTGIDSSMPFSSKAFYIGRSALLGYQAPKMGAATIYRCAIDHMIEQDLLQDEVFQKTGMYHDTKKVDEALIGRWLGIEVGISSEGWYEAAGTMNTYSATGDVHTGWFYANDAFGCVSPVRGGEGVGNVEFFNIMTPDSNNITLAATYHSYRAYFASVVPFGLWVHGVSCGNGFSIPGDVHL